MVEVRETTERSERVVAASSGNAERGVYRDEVLPFFLIWKNTFFCYFSIKTRLFH